MNASKKNNLRLVGKNFEDIKVISAYLQDSIVTIISESINVVLHDLGKPWIVKYVPIHKI